MAEGSSQRVSAAAITSANSNNDDNKDKYFQAPAIL